MSCSVWLNWVLMKALLSSLLMGYELIASFVVMPWNDSSQSWASIDALFCFSLFFNQIIDPLLLLI